jgi:hypothetical protein
MSSHPDPWCFGEALEMKVSNVDTVSIRSDDAAAEGKRTALLGES